MNFKTFSSYSPYGLPSRVINNTHSGGIEHTFLQKRQMGHFQMPFLLGTLQMSGGRQDPW